MAEKVFDTLSKSIEANAEVAKKVNGIYQFKLTGPDSSWVLDLKEGKVYKGDASKSDVVLTLAEKDFIDLFSGKANGQQLFMSGKIKFKGNMGLLLKLQDVQALA